jgi:hypothetical protein
VEYKVCGRDGVMQLLHSRIIFPFYLQSGYAQNGYRPVRPKHGN